MTLYERQDDTIPELCPHGKLDCSECLDEFRAWAKKQNVKPAVVKKPAVRSGEPRLYANILTNERLDQWTEVYLGMAIALNAFGYIDRRPSFDRDGVPAYEANAKWHALTKRFAS